MIEIRIHGRGGQGVVLASHILARAAHREGYFVQVFPEFGVERRGAPVTAFARLDRDPIRIRTRVYAPDDAIVLDPALVRFVDVTEGLRRDGRIVVNARTIPGELADGPWCVAAVDAAGIAASHGIGTSTAPIVNTTMVGAFARVSRLVSIEAVCGAIGEVVPSGADRNAAAAREAYEAVSIRADPIQAALQGMFEE